MNRYGFVKMAVASPKLKIANPEYNASEIARLMTAAAESGAAAVVFPELSLTGYTCGDLFHQKFLLDKTREALAGLVSHSAGLPTLTLAGLPLFVKDRLYNCAAAIQNGRLLGVVPKSYLPNYKEFYEKRWFTSGSGIMKSVRSVELLDETVPFGQVLFRSKELGFTLGVEICEDVWTPIPPSSVMTLHGANVIANPSASNELVAKADYRRQLISQQSARCMCAYLYAAAGVHESTTDNVFSGDCMICENGSLLSATPKFSRESEITFADIDIEKLNSERQLNKSFADTADFAPPADYQVAELAYPADFYNPETQFARKIDKSPFVPKDQNTMDERCREIFSIQVAGLAGRLEHTGMSHAVVGVSGGLDSTLALLVAKRTFDLLGLPSGNIAGVTMPGFGTTDRTYDNAVRLMQNLRVGIREIDIKDACLQHFKDIGHDSDIHDVTYENTQARERTQILMDLANQSGGLVVGTGDLSELALGWCTYNGDHMSMYAVNSSVPKTLVQHLIRWYSASEYGLPVRQILSDILDTPISPELLPPDKAGKIRQKTENIVGPYELHDFFLYHVVRYGTEPEKLLFLAVRAFGPDYSKEEILSWLKLFYKRFFSQQFKRSCLPDGPKVGSVSLSPRGDWRMPSDADGSLWIRELEEKPQNQNLK